MGTLTDFISQTDLSDKDYEKYEVIENQRVESINLKNQAVSGVLFSLTTFTRVHFENIDFFATRFENCEFIDCVFDNCKFQFSTIIYCDFHRAIFTASLWNATSVKKGLFSQCLLDHHSEKVASPEENKIIGPLSAFESTMTLILEKMAA